MVHPTGRMPVLQRGLRVVLHFNRMNLLTLTEIRRATQNRVASARVHVQVENATPKLTREQQPYCELTLADACDRITLRVWSDHPAYKTCSALTNQDFIELTAEFFQSQYGLDARKWTVRPLTEQEKKELLQGPADLRAKQASDFEFVKQTLAGISDPRLVALGEAFLSEWGERFRRTAAARNYHHARRGGLVEHTAQMMRVAKEIAPLYPELNLDLLLTGRALRSSRTRRSGRVSRSRRAGALLASRPRLPLFQAIAPRGQPSEAARRPLHERDVDRHRA